MSRETSNRKILNKIMKKVVSFTENRYRKITDSYSRSEVFKQCLPYLNSHGAVLLMHTGTQLHWQTIAKAKIAANYLANITDHVRYLQCFAGYTCVITLRNGWSRVAPQNASIRLNITYPTMNSDNSDDPSVNFDILSNNFAAHWMKGIRLVTLRGSSKPEHDGLYIQILVQTGADPQYYESCTVEINHNYNYALSREVMRFEVMSVLIDDEYHVPSNIRDEIDLLIRNETSHIQTFATTTIEGKRYGMRYKLDKTGGILSGNISVEHNGNGINIGPSITAQFAGSSGNNVSLHATKNDLHGLYSTSPEGWLIQEDTSGRAYTKATSEHVRSIQIVANTDLNTCIINRGFYKHVTFYYCPNNSVVATLKNCPTTNAFCLRVEVHAGYYQELTEYVTTNPRKFFRNQYIGTWGPWYEMNYKGVLHQGKQLLQLRTEGLGTVSLLRLGAGKSTRFINNFPSSISRSKLLGLVPYLKVTGADLSTRRQAQYLTVSANIANITGVGTKLLITITNHHDISISLLSSDYELTIMYTYIS